MYPLRRAADVINIGLSCAYNQHSEKRYDKILTTIGNVLEEFNGAAFGEIHGNYSSADFMTELAPFFKAQNVRTLFVEHFSQGTQPMVDKWQNDQEESVTLRQWIEANHYHSYATYAWQRYWKMFNAYKDVGIKIVGIDSDTIQSVYPGTDMYYRNAKWDDRIREELAENDDKGSYLIYCGQDHLFDRTSGGVSIVSMQKIKGFVLDNGAYAHRRMLDSRLYSLTVPKAADQTQITGLRRMQSAKLTQ